METDLICGTCEHFTGEECNSGPCEGYERYHDDPACEHYGKLVDNSE
ncbi:MAG: hypothetical protein ACM31M_09640 [Nitrososphaerota archaeon]